MFVTSERCPGRAQKSSGDFGSALAAPVLVAERDQSPFSSLGCDACGEVPRVLRPDVGAFQLQRQGLCGQGGKQCLLVLPSRLLKRYFGGCVMVLECDSV